MTAQLSVMIPAFCRAISWIVFPRIAVCSSEIGVMTQTCGVVVGRLVIGRRVEHIRGVEEAAEPDFDHLHIDTGLAERDERRRRQRIEREQRATGELRRDLLDRLSHRRHRAAKPSREIGSPSMRMRSV